jgi:copper chaperone
MVMKKSISIKKMDNEDAADRVSQVLHDVWGIRKVEVNRDKGEATISYDENAASFHDFEQALADVGFEISNEQGPIKQ